jgi:hypothetical protein
MTIHEVKARYLEMNPEGHFFDRQTMKFFGQTLRSFGVTYIGDDKYIIRAKITNEHVSRMSEHTFDYKTGRII